MDASSEAVDLIVKKGVQITEEAAKLVGLGAKNLAAIIIALIKDDNKLQGKTKLKKLLKSEKPLCILQIKEEDLKKFTSEAKKYGVLFTAVGDKTNDSGFIDIIAKQEDVAKLNYIIQEKLGYLEPIAEDIEPEKEDSEKADNAEDKETQSEEQSKNEQTRAEENPPEKESTKHGDTEKTDRGTKPSVKKKIEDIKAQKKAKKQDKEPEKAKSQHKSNNKSKKKNKGKKGKSR